jgi:hypothetical protein
MKTLFAAPYVPSATNAINLAALYFDEVVLYERQLMEVEPVEASVPLPHGEGRGRVRRFVSTIDEGLREAIRPLVDENIVRIEPEPPVRLLQPSKRESLNRAFEQVVDLLVIPKDDGTGALIPLGESGVEEIHKMLVGPVALGKRFHIEAITAYYQGLFVESVDAALRGEAVLSSSPLLYRMIERAAEGTGLNPRKIAEVFPSLQQPRLAMDILRATLINSSNLRADEVIEARFLLNDELIGFRSELQRLQFEFTHEFGPEKVFREGRLIADARLSPRVKEIEAKVRGGRVRVLRRIIESLEKPDAYVPLVGGLFAGVPLVVALGLSLGLISARVALEAMEEHAQVANDGLLYLVKMNRLIGSQTVNLGLPIQSSDDADTGVYKNRFLWPADVVRLDEDDGLDPKLTS